MLRVGLTGDLGSGKSTVARMLADRGAIILSSDEMARAMMQPGHPVFASVVDHFGPSVVSTDGCLDRRKLAELAFNPTHPRVEELNAIIHPAVLDEQAKRIEEIARTQPDAIVVVESALIFTTTHSGEPWRKRFDRILLVTAPEGQKIQRFVDRIASGRELSSDERLGLETDARRRLALQTPTPALARECRVLQNDDDLANLEKQVEDAWRNLQSLNEQNSPPI